MVLDSDKFVFWISVLIFEKVARPSNCGETSSNVIHPHIWRLQQARVKKSWKAWGVQSTACVISKLAGSKYTSPVELWSNPALLEPSNSRTSAGSFSSFKLWNHLLGRANNSTMLVSTRSYSGNEMVPLLIAQWNIRLITSSSYHLYRKFIGNVSVKMWKERSSG